MPTIMNFEPYCSNLDNNISTGLHRFAYGNPLFAPKIMVSGAILYVLPDEESHYFVAIKDGNIREV